jgi:hypothetical protein
MPTPLDDVCLASLPRDGLAALAEVRRVGGVAVTFAGDRAWVRWPPGRDEVLRCVLPVRGAKLFLPRDGGWSRFGSRLPAFDVPSLDAGRPLSEVLTPALFEPEPPGDTPLTPRALRLVRDDRPRPTAALLCDLAALGAWADTATTASLAAVEAARLGDRVLLLGRRLPALPGAEPFWGGGVLVPLGLRPEPAWPESALRDALGVGGDEVALLGEAGVTVVPREALRPLTRAAARLAVREEAP